MSLARVAVTVTTLATAACSYAPPQAPSAPGSVPSVRHTPVPTSDPEEVAVVDILGGDSTWPEKVGFRFVDGSGRHLTTNELRIRYERAVGRDDVHSALAKNKVLALIGLAAGATAVTAGSVVLIHEAVRQEWDRGDVALVGLTTLLAVALDVGVIWASTSSAEDWHLMTRTQANKLATRYNEAIHEKRRGVEPASVGANAASTSGPSLRFGPGGMLLVF